METHISDTMDLTQALVKIDSSDPGACEGEIGEYLFRLLSGLGVSVTKKEVLPGRFNTMAKLPGTPFPGFLPLMR